MTTHHRATGPALLTAAGLLLLLPLAGTAAPPAKPKPAAGTRRPQAARTTYALLQTTRGPIYLELFTQQTPLTAGNMVKLIRQGFYDNIMFHRVEPGFVVQAGDPLSKSASPDDPNLGKGGPGYTIKLEESATRLKHQTGSLSMARRQTDRDSAGSQFFICLSPQPGLDGDYAVFGRVVRGMDVVNRIQKGDRIKKATLLSSLPAPARPSPKRKR